MQSKMTLYNSIQFVTTLVLFMSGITSANNILGSYDGNNSTGNLDGSFNGVTIQVYLSGASNCNSCTQTSQCMSDINWQQPVDHMNQLS